MEPVYDPAFCPRFHEAVELLGRRWNGVILRVLLRGPARFADIRDTVPGLSDTMLSERLKQLEAYQLVEREVEPSTPVRITYALTVKGRALEVAIRAISAWAEEWLEAPESASAPA